MKKNVFSYCLLILFIILSPFFLNAEEKNNPLLQSWPQYLKLKKEGPSISN